MLSVKPSRKILEIIEKSKSTIVIATYELDIVIEIAERIIPSGIRR